MPLRRLLPLVLVATALTPSSSASASGNGMLNSDDHTLHASVGTYSDCTGRTPLQSGEAALDPCIKGRHYFLGHNAGVFTPLLHMQPGDHLDWTDGRGADHRLRIVAVRDWYPNHGAPPVTEPDVVAQFQTCAREDGSLERILDTVQE
ncbi:MAG TPA: hypothetical protein VH134_10830 [Candidatus Dormibacteraeota bacterium]|jgi:hypothetical protein|nr:hypothetical protein [Candidatus Dormibacteraeota bacterium]